MHSCRAALNSADRSPIAPKPSITTGELSLSSILAWTVSGWVKMFKSRMLLSKLAWAYAWRAAISWLGYKPANISSSILATQLPKEMPASVMRASVPE
uniref:Uncharacterized protein n=1 Tax=Anopheles atroparvus TaxID=41427 RepID=A0AAG5DS99_ANOAO